MLRTNRSSSTVALITLISLGAFLPSCSSSGGDDNANTFAGSGGASAGETGLGGASASGTSGSVSSSGSGGATTNGGTAGSGGATTNGGTAGSDGANAGNGGNAGSGGAAGATTNGGAAGSAGASAGNGGAAGSAGSAGATTNGGAAGSSGATAGSGGAAGSAGSAGAAPCGGCAVLSAPLAASGDSAIAQIVFNSANFTGVTVTVRACIVAGNPHSIFKVYVQDGVTENYIGNYNAGQLYDTFDTISACSVGMQNLTVTVASSDSSDAFVSTDVSALTIQIATDGTGPWVPSVVDIDSIVLSPAVVDTSSTAVGPWDFTSDASPLALQGTPVTGSTLTWIP